MELCDQLKAARAEREAGAVARRSWDAARAGHLVPHHMGIRPSAQRMAFSDSPRRQRLQSSAFCAAVKRGPRRRNMRPQFLPHAARRPERTRLVWSNPLGARRGQRAPHLGSSSLRQTRAILNRRRRPVVIARAKAGTPPEGTWTWPLGSTVSLAVSLHISDLEMARSARGSKPKQPIDLDDQRAVLEIRKRWSHRVAFVIVDDEQFAARLIFSAQAHIATERAIARVVLHQGADEHLWGRRVGDARGDEPGRETPLGKVDPVHLNTRLE